MQFIQISTSCTATKFSLQQELQKVGTTLLNYQKLNEYMLEILLQMSYSSSQA